MKNEAIFSTKKKVFSSDRLTFSALERMCE